MTNGWLTHQNADQEFSSLYVRQSELLQNVPPHKSGTVLVPYIRATSLLRIPYVQSFGIVLKCDI
jgi:hypothetical protein